MKHLPEVSYVGKGLLDLIESVTPGSTAIFEESYLEYNISGTVEKDEYGEEIVTRPPSTKTIITYKLK